MGSSWENLTISLELKGLKEYLFIDYRTFTLALLFTIVLLLYFESSIFLELKFLIWKEKNNIKIAFQDGKY